jgi:hypothetical protein
MTTLRRFRAHAATNPDRAARLLDRMRGKAGHAATVFTQRSKPQADRRHRARP